MEIKFTIQGLLIYAAMAGYLVGFMLAVFRLKKLAGFVYFAGFLFAAAAFVYRGIHVNHVPMQNLFEVFVTLGMVMYPVSLFSRRFLRISGGPGDAADMLLGFIVLFPAGFVFHAEPQMLPPALQCWLFAPHVAVYMLSYMIMAKANYLAFGRVLSDMRYNIRFKLLISLITALIAYLIAIPLLFKFKSDPHFFEIPIGELSMPVYTDALIYAGIVTVCAFALGKLIFILLQFVYRICYIDSENLGDLLPYEDSTYRMVCTGFPLLTLGLILGSWWGKLAWGDYWGWDPKELWSLVSWLAYLSYFHFRAMYGKKFPRINSLLAILGMVAIIITLLWVNLSKMFPGLHNYAS